MISIIQPKVAPTGDGSLKGLCAHRAENLFVEPDCTFQCAFRAIYGPDPFYEPLPFL